MTDAALRTNGCFFRNQEDRHRKTPFYSVIQALVEGHTFELKLDLRLQQMKHETFNSVLGALGLCVAVVTAWYQFAPAADDIELVSEGRVNLGRELEFQPVGLGAAFGGSPMSVAGPVSWKIRVYNASDRAVSVVGFSIYLLREDDGKIQYSAMHERLSPFDASLKEQILPVGVASREAKAFLVSLSMPFRRDQSADGKCEEQTNQLRELERCFFLKGRDLFGNPVTVTKYDDEPDGPMSVSWDLGNEGPRFSVVFETADGSRFETRLSYFPNF